MNSKFTKTIALLLSAAMLLCLCACGKTGEGTGTDDKPGKNEPVETPEYTYIAEYKPISGTKNSFYPELVTEKGFYFESSEKVGENIPEGVVPEWEGQYDVYETFLYYTDLDGNAHKLEKFEKPDPNEFLNPIPEGARDAYTGAYISVMANAGDGKLALIWDLYESYNDAPESIEMYTDQYWEYSHNEEKYFISLLDAEGATLSTNELDTSSMDYFYAYNGQVIGDNLITAGDGGVYVFGLDGSFRFRISSEYWYDGLYELNGKLYALGYGESGQELVEINLETKSFGEKLPLTNLYGNYIRAGSGKYDLYTSTGLNLYGYDIETATSEKLLSWLNCGINGNNIDRYIVRDDGTVITYENKWNSDYTECKSQLVFLKQVPYDSVPHKEPITLACQYLDYQVLEQIIAFNRSNEQYTIEVTDYSEYNTEDDWEAGITKLNTEILSGKIPDIIALNGLPAKQYAAKGILADLYPYIDADPDINRSDFFENVLKACENDGRLFTTVSNFAVDTVVGAASVVGDKIGWNYDQYYAALASMPEGCEPFDKYFTRSNALYTILNFELERFVDWNTGKCSFDSPEFIEVLEFIKSFPNDLTGDFEWTEEDDTPNRITSGRQMLMNTEIYGFDDIAMYNAMFGGDITFVGYPTSEGVGSMLYTDSGYAMTTSCKNPDAAWQFLRSFFTADYQRENSWNLPSNREVFDERLKAAMTPNYMMDENGNYVLDENGERIEESRGSWGWGSVVIEMRTLTQEEADEILEVIEKTTHVYNRDESIMSIINEQITPFFEGQKTAAEVAKLIQSQANLYVNEQR